MAETGASRLDGDTFQARMFWLNAASLLDPDGAIIRLGFEVGPKAFDDIWIEYDPRLAPPDQYGKPLLREHVQCKWHVTPDQYGYSELIQPEFINANAISFLERARNAGANLDTKSDNARFSLLTNWRIDRNDPLKGMVGTRSNAVRVDRLFASKTDNSKDGRVRKAWREHLGIDDEELGRFASILKFSEAPDSLQDLRTRLDERFASVGLRRIPLNESVFPYDAIVNEWMIQGRRMFDRDDLRRACDREGLLAERKARPVSYGVKSFEHAIDPLHHRCTKTLDLTPEFDERFIKDQSAWKEVLYPRLVAFLTKAAANDERLRLILDAHTTLAFAAGSVLDIKSGKEIELEQRTLGRHIWRPGDSVRDSTWSTWKFEHIAGDAESKNVVAAVSLTHEICAEVQAYLAGAGLNPGLVLIARPSGGSGARSVISGQHAFELAEGLQAELRKSRKATGRTHLFIAAPNAFTFFLGQRRLSLGGITLYEFDFGAERTGSYAPALSLPIEAGVANL